MPGDRMPGDEEAQTLSLHAEQVVLSKRLRRTLVTAARTTSLVDEIVTAELEHDEVVVERVAVGKAVEVAPPIRREGDVTIIPVMAEELVLVRRLVLKEEIHLRQVRRVTRFSETVPLRRQSVTVTRTALDDRPASPAGVPQSIFNEGHTND